MLTEEALIFVAALGALGLVMLGVLELLWPTRPKHPVRRRTPAKPKPAAVAATPTPKRWRSNRPRHAAGARDRTAYARRQPPSPLPPFFARADAPGVAPSDTDTGAETFARSLLERAEVRPAEPEPQPVTDAVEFVADRVPPVESTPPPDLEIPVYLPRETEPEPEIDTPVSAEPTIELPREETTADVPVVESEPEPEPETIGAATVESCFELYQASRYTEVVEIAGRALSSGAGAPRPADAHEVAALWSVLALAHQGLGDHAAARSALESAIEAAPEADRATYKRQLASLALAVAQSLIASAAGHAAPDSEARVTELRDALDWLDRGREVAPTDVALRELTASTETMLWPAYEQVVMALVQRQEYRTARRLLRDALNHPRLPSTRGETFHELFSGTFSGEIGQLTAQAIRSMQEARETEALGALQRAEGLIESIHAEALPPKRREEVDRRLWWGYNKLGVRRVEAGQFEDALDPLFHALRMAGSAPDRQAETRAALVRAFEGFADARALAIREVAETGDREAAIVQSDKLWTRIKAASEQGLSSEDLAGALARVQRLFQQIGRERS